MADASIYPAEIPRSPGLMRVNCRYRKDASLTIDHLDHRTQIEAAQNQCPQNSPDATKISYRLR